MTDEIAPPKVIYVYVLTDPRYPDDVRYVGVTDNPQRRLRQHISKSKGKTYHRANWINSLLDNGLKPMMTIIDETDENNWRQCEIEWIARYRAMGCDLVNSTDGGGGVRGYVPTEEHRRKQSESIRGENHPFYGKHFSEEHRRKLSEAKRGKERTPHSEEHRRKQSEAMTGKRFPTRKPRSEEHRRRLSEANKGKVYDDEYCRKLSNASTKKKRVAQYTKDGVFIRYWDGVNVASKGLNIPHPNISACCRGEYRQAGGYIFRYADDSLLDIPPTQLKLDFEE